MDSVREGRGGRSLTSEPKVGLRLATNAGCQAAGARLGVWHGVGQRVCLWGSLSCVRLVSDLVQFNLKLENIDIIIIILIISITITITIIIVTLPRLPPTHLEYSFADSLTFGVRGLDRRGLRRFDVWRLQEVQIRTAW